MNSDRPCLFLWGGYRKGVKTELEVDAKVLGGFWEPRIEWDISGVGFAAGVAAEDSG